MSENGSLRAGVVGVGSMGQHHARVYAHHDNVSLVGVADADAGAAQRIAAEYDTDPLATEDLLEVVDAVSVVVPTRYHYEVARKALYRDVDVLVEKPLVKEPAEGARLVDLANERDRVLQVGHVERFNPAIRTLRDVLTDEEVIGIEAQRLGPPVDRDSTDSVVRDLMVHDLDIALSLVDGDVASVAATGARDGQHVVAHLQFEGDVVGQFTASRVTQQKVRRLAVTTEDCRINVDYADQDVEIHRLSVPAYVETDGDVRYRHESVIERPTVENGEPLAKELDEFVEAVVTGSRPPVTGEDGLRALELACEVDRQATAAEADERRAADDQAE
ncbi:MAG: Gfo/Idh/MocA family oxidoreductase [Haloarculaceae archaeon]